MESKLDLIAGYTPSGSDSVIRASTYVLQVLLDTMDHDVVFRHLDSFLNGLSSIPETNGAIIGAFDQFVMESSDTAHRSNADETQTPYPIPTPEEQRMRVCALNVDLVDFLHHRYKDCEYSQAVVRKWYTDNSERLKGTGLTVETVSVDHILPRSIGGHSCVYNYCLLSRRDNSRFGDRITTEKRQYIGRQAVKIANGFACWVRSHSDPQVSRFNVGNYMVVNDRPH